MKRSSRLFRKGFISTWYLSIFLYAVTLVSVMMLNDSKRLMILYNLRTAQNYLNMESEVIQDIRCMIAYDRLTDGMHETDNTQYFLTSNGELLYVEFLYPLEEEMTLAADENGVLLDAETVRNQAEVMYPD